ncbi:ImmA/IrrE family metallo-endopeptidase [Evansella clarkii]|uniref:ImmA/IrrE family metallo-endopeptidase n=1 Tax=Evansella clarkii TaxID=79879 RepID=UPI0009975BFD|nr:ImmA/IrrE family metallo-endopeptidase [Evansella clarkii]
MQYIHSHREEWVLRFYKRMQINHPDDIDIKVIARHHRIYLKYHYKPTTFVQMGNYRAINLQYGLTTQEERIHFFHELGHLLRHSGSQLFMTDSFKELQEWDANFFTFYASLPFHMIKDYDFDDKGTIIELSQVFMVPEWFAAKRVEFIKKKTHEYQLLMKGVI